MMLLNYYIYTDMTCTDHASGMVQRPMLGDGYADSIIMFFISIIQKRLETIVTRPKCTS